ncbi:MAG TPA: L-serine ammonia-lyase, iron-sulfur-dependent, subunit alpha [Oscillospiraceae bacterium]|nr:L-serine ammonia-lyase, iron-sulfur-dependent, subunit alpha [Oscillospiraceae bacterium]
MESLKELYKIGRGPSSSHTMGPEKACKIFQKHNPEADRFEAILYGSLSKTGVGHGTDKVIKVTFEPTPCDVIFNNDEIELPHPNTMDLIAYKDGIEIKRIRVLSVGGGKVEIVGYKNVDPPKIYDLSTFSEIAEHCKKNHMRLWQYVEEVEGIEIRDYLLKIWNQMKLSIHIGLETEGVLPGGLNVKRKAKKLYSHQHIDESAQTKENRVVSAYAFAVSEQNADGEVIVTAPTCGSAGVMPSVLYYQQMKRGYTDLEIIRALETGGIIGNLIKTNASISGSECGCQAEIGTACAMASAALGELFGLETDKIEYAAEIAIEHHLGLTCDPICGLVQIPCIERNAVAAMRAINAVSLASFLSDTRKISVDEVIEVMRMTGKDIPGRYRETAEGGLATLRIK